MSTNELAEATRTLGLELDETALDRLSRYRDAIAEGAVAFSLTAVREPAEIERRHLVESLAFGAMLRERDLLPDGTRVLDIGSGAGLPGLPLKIGWPSLEVRLLEAHGRRCRFMRDTILDLGLKGIDVLEGRAEDVARDPEQRSAYGLVIARAVAPLPVLLEYALPFVRQGGFLAATKGSSVHQELEDATAALAALNGALVDTVAFRPPDGLEQSVVIVRQVEAAPERYPRRSGMPTKRPLR